MPTKKLSKRLQKTCNNEKTQKESPQWQRKKRRFSYTNQQLNEVLRLCTADRQKPHKEQQSVAGIIRDYVKTQTNCSIPENTVTENLRKGVNGDTTKAHGSRGHSKLTREDQEEFARQVLRA